MGMGKKKVVVLIGYGDFDCRAGDGEVQFVGIRGGRMRQAKRGGIVDCMTAS